MSSTPMIPPLAPCARVARRTAARIAATAALLVCALALHASPPPAAATPAAPAAVVATESGSSAMGELMGIVLPLVLIIVVLLAVLYLVRRRFGLTGQDAPLSVLQILPLGPRERLVLVKSRSGRIFTVGVAAQSVTLVTHLDPADLVAPSANVAGGSVAPAAGETIVTHDTGSAR